MSVRRMHFRPPGVKTGSKIGPLGPFRGTLGIQWVIGSLAVGLLILFAATWGIFQAGRPEPPFRSVGQVASLAPGSATKALPGVFVGRGEDGRVYAVTEGVNCPLEVGDEGYLDCLGLRYGWNGQPLRRGEPLIRLPVKVYRGEIFVAAADGDAGT